MNDIQLHVFARTDIGMQRSGNEDAFLVADLTTGNVGLGPDMSKHRIGERGSLMVVSDGMGGAVAGEIASELAVTTIRDSLMEMPLDLNISDSLRMATEIANERIWNHAQQNPELSGMGATLTAVLAHDTVAYIAQVGDSRAYLVRGSQIKQLTKDQSLAQMLVDSGAIQPDQIGSVPQNVIMQALGTQPTVKVALTGVKLFRNDSLLVCSDGLSNKIKAPEMREIVEKSDSLTIACRRLVEIANERGGEDNITVIVARFDGEALHTATDTNSITGSFMAISEDYLSEKASGLAAHYEPPKPSESAAPPTTMVMQALKSQSPVESPEADSQDRSTRELATETSGSSPETALLSSTAIAGSPATVDQESIPTQPVPVQQAPPQTEAQRPVTVSKPLLPKRRNYTAIFVIAFISLLLLAGAAFFFYYYYYYKPHMEQQNAPDATAPVSRVEYTIRDKG